MALTERCCVRMKTEYKHYTEITKEILDNIKVGMLVKINDWKRPMKVVGVSENYFCMIQKVCGKICYSVCEKNPWGRIRHNEMRGGMFHCGTDNMIFGYLGFDYEFNDEEQIKDYLQAFESEEIELSVRNGVPIFDLYVKE